MGEQDHGLHVEPVPRLPGAERLPAANTAARAITDSLPGLSAEAQRSVLAVLHGNAVVRAAIETTEAIEDESDRSGAS